ncbi:MAG: hypothetical protein LBR55_03190 [Bacteroidales bacterium]|jgi:Spy/CpxP family protein refolding chaperone|nr:hypothetical protein [Bacteroidales bacterium]
MNVKNVVIGVILIVVGAFIGYAISSKTSACKCEKQEQCCAKKYACKQGKGAKAKCFMKQKNFCPQMCDQLNLTEEQRTKVKALFAKKAEQKATARMQRQEQKQAEFTQFQAEFKAILTTDQQEKLDSIQAVCKAKQCCKKSCDATACCKTAKCGDTAKCCKKGDAAQCKKEGNKECAKKTEGTQQESKK